jgi:L-fuculose-phosphate aldolase
MTDAALAALYRALAAHRMVVASSGNVSARRGAGFAITATGALAESITEAQIVTLTLDGAFEGPQLPSSEWAMHAAIYRAAPHAQVIVHTHSDAAVALSCLDEPLPPFHYMLAEFGGHDVRCAPYVTFGTPQLAEAAVTAIAGRTACLLAHHGMICHGRTGPDALATALRLETLARQYLLARAAGTPRMLTPAEMDGALLRYRTYGQQTGETER